MDALDRKPRRVAPTDAAVLPLIRSHLSLMRAASPACSAHVMEPDALSNADAQFFAAFEDGQAIAMGALKTIASDHGEIKSMHVRSDQRGGDLADAILLKLLQCAQHLGMTRVSLETGSQDAFLPARAFYRRHKFSECGPFGPYKPDRNSVFMTRIL